MVSRLIKLNLAKEEQWRTGGVIHGLLTIEQFLTISAVFCTSRDEFSHRSSPQAFSCISQNPLDVSDNNTRGKGNKQTATAASSQHVSVRNRGAGRSPRVPLLGLSLLLSSLPRPRLAPAPHPLPREINEDHSLGFQAREGLSGAPPGAGAKS